MQTHCYLDSPERFTYFGTHRQRSKKRSHKTSYMVAAGTVVAAILCDSDVYGSSSSGNVAPLRRHDYHCNNHPDQLHHPTNPTTTILIVIAMFCIFIFTIVFFTIIFPFIMIITATASIAPAALCTSVPVS